MQLPQEFMRGKGIQRPLEVETRTLDELREARGCQPGGGGLGLRIDSVHEAAL